MSTTTSRATHWDIPRTVDALHPPHRLLRLMRPMGRAYFRKRYDVRVHGAHHVPATGPAILASNHIGLLDGPLLEAFAPRPLHALTKKEMFEGLTGRALLALGQIPLERHGVDVRAILACLRVLRDDGLVGIYPEGTRGDGEVHTVRNGVAYLGLVTGSPILPVAMFGTREPGGATDSVPPRGARFDLVIGAPQRLPRTPWPRTKADVAASAVQVRRWMTAHVNDAQALTGRRLPGPIPGIGQDDLDAARRPPRRRTP